MEQQHPLLLPKLQTALSCLYGNHETQHHRHEAHEFLLGFKSSNVRRTAVSRIQSQKDKVGDQNTLDLGEDHAGSVFLSSLALILQKNCESHERVFAAQTMNHRCRSIQLAETLDIEAEDGLECGMARLVLAWEEIRAERARLSAANASENALGEKSKMILTAWLERYVPMLAHRCGGGGHAGSTKPSDGSSFCDGAEILAEVLQRHSSSLLPNTNNDNTEDYERQEEQIKGTLIMLTLAVAMYVSAFCDHEEEHKHTIRSPWANTVLSDLGSALSITALRVRYKSMADKHATPSPDLSCPPLIDMLVNAVNLVKESAEAHFSQKMQQLGNNNEAIHNAIHQAHLYAINRSIAACMKALPETVLLPLGQEDGHRVPSVDRACLRAASMELRSVGSNLDNDVGTGMDKAWKVLMESERSHSQLLECCEAWARFVAVPIHVIEVTVGSLAVEYLHVSRSSSYSQQQEKARMAAFQYLVSIFESASPSLTSGDILTAALGVSAGGHKGKGGGVSSKNTKKKQGNKSKKRHEKRLGRALAVQDSCQDGGTADAAEKELLARRNAACVAAAAVFGVSLTDASIMGDDWGLRQAVTSPPTSTHGICSTVASAAASVLPHLLRLERGDGEGESSQKWRLVLFSAIATVIRRMCASPSRDVRALAYEPLMLSHTSLNSVAAVSLKMEQVAVDVTCECGLALAASCGYPPGYFDCLTEDNDGELEMERNDVRDVARSVCSLDSGGHNSPSILILESIVSACNSAVRDSVSAGHLPPETVVHILSALAKPLNKLGKNYKEQPSAIGCAIMTMSMQTLGVVCDQLNSSFDSRSISQILPLSRLALMGTASFTPMYTCLLEVMKRHAASDAEKEMFATLKRTFLSSLQHSMLSVARIPELAAESTLELTRYDIKGAMRGPGGEDHVGCIALMRFSHESDHSTDMIFEVYGSKVFNDLSSLHRGLKASELERGVGCDYGIGACPVSRRMILRVISRLALYGMKSSNDQASEGRVILQQFVQAPLSEMRSQKEAPMSAEKMFRVCESALDLSFFSPELVSDLFINPSDDLGVMFQCVITGYSHISFTSDADAMCQQWGRLRGGAHSVLKTSMKETITDYSASVISALIKAECEAATLQCNQGPASGSNFFNDNVVGEEMVHSGVYIMLVRDRFDMIKKKKVQGEKEMIECRQCLSVLKNVAPVITPLLLHQSPETNSHVDPRPTIAEAWFLTLVSLISVCRNDEQIASTLVGDGVESFLGESLSIAMALIFLKDLGAKKALPPATQKGMSLDGPHTLAILRFVSESMLLGPSILSAASVVSAIPVNDTFGQSNIGASIVTAGLLRGVSGALPPWAVEETPALFKSMHVAMGRDTDMFVQTMSVSTKLQASVAFGGVREGELLAGRYLDVSDRHIESCLSQTKKVCDKDDWNKLKVILKATCGGKKKDAGFNLKPPFTSWECERL